jgi:hypothetical protein
MQRLNLAQEPDKRHGLLCHVTGKNFQASEEEMVWIQMEAHCK